MNYLNEEKTNENKISSKLAATQKNVISEDHKKYVFYESEKPSKENRVGLSIQRRFYNPKFNSPNIDR